MGGIRLIKKICERCSIDYLGIHNQQLCNQCKSNGYEHKCKSCEIDYFSNSRYRIYCEECFDNKVWLLGKKRDPLIGEKISKSKIEFFKTEKGNVIKQQVGLKNSIKLKRHFSTKKGKSQIKNTAVKQSQTMRKKIADGEFIPCITNSWTHWDAKIEIEKDVYKKFRSSWESCFWYSNQHLSYETFRVQYTDKKNKKRTYIADFYDKQTNTLYEIKPKSEWNNQLHKMNSIINFCILNDITFIWVNEFNIMNYIKVDIFKDKNKLQLNKLLDGIKKN